MMLRGFVCCNGGLDRALLTNANSHGSPGACALPLRSRAPRRRVALNPKNQSRSLWPISRAEDRRKRVASNPRSGRDLVALHARAPKHPALAHRATASETTAARQDSSRAPAKTLVADVWARANVLAFSCEAARVISQCSQNVVRLRLLQRRVRLQDTGIARFPCRGWRPAYRDPWDRCGTPRETYRAPSDIRPGREAQSQD
jgi:hypothetical protein